MVEPGPFGIRRSLSLRAQTIMRIAEINDIASVASEIGAGLRARGHDVTLFHPRLVGASLHPQVKPITAPVRALDWLDLIRRVRKGNFDLVHIHYAYLGNIGALGGFPYLLHCHGTDLRGATAVTRPLIRRALRNAEHVFYSTPDLEQFVLPYRPDGEFLPNPIDTEQFHAQVPARDRSSVYICCGLTEIKGAGRLLKACQQLAVERPNIRITALGGGEYTPAFQALPNVTVIAHQPRWKLPDIINRHGVIVGQVRLGSAGMAELEAMACGRPVITWFNELHAYRDVPPYVTAVDAVDVAAAIKDLVDKPELRESLGTKGRNWVIANHSLDRVVDRVEAVAEAIIAGEPIPAIAAA
ncbi:MAG: glycosyltransferase family 4 protein [Dehalococcoidia bacterium]